MADALKILGQLNPAATTLSDLYTVPAATSVSTSSVTVCNQAGTGTTFRLSAALAGAADAVKQYLFYDQTLDAKATFIATVGLTLAATDVLRCYAGNANCSFNVFGVEVT